jgi:hypothetical protein
MKEFTLMVDIIIILSRFSWHEQPRNRHEQLLNIDDNVLEYNHS